MTNANLADPNLTTPNLVTPNLVTPNLTTPNSPMQPVPQPLQAPQAPRGMPLSSNIQTVILQASQRFANMTDVERLQIELIGLLTATLTQHNAEVTASAQKLTMVNTLLISRHTQDTANINYLKKQVEYERSKVVVRNQQIEMWRVTHAQMQREIGRLQEQLKDAENRVINSVDSHQPMISPKIFLSLPAEPATVLGDPTCEDAMCEIPMCLGQS